MPDEKDPGPTTARRRKGGNGVIMAVLIVVAAVAVRRQLRLPRDERTWHGTVDVPVPFEFRRPTRDLVLSKVWNPAEPRLFTPTLFGVGWTVNVARLLGRQPDTSKP